ncbi:hypothetical protein BH09ACT7_BH09ACT7_49850 [soil metagenome]
MAEQFWLLHAGAVTIGIGAAMVVGCGVAAADTGGSDGAESTSRSAVHDKPVRSTSAAVDSPDPATPPSSTKTPTVKVSAGKPPRAVLTAARSTDVKSRRLVTQRKQSARDVIPSTVVSNAIDTQSISLPHTAGSASSVDVVKPVVDTVLASTPTAPTTTAVSTPSPRSPGPVATLMLNAFSALGVSVRPEPAEATVTPSTTSSVALTVTAAAAPATAAVATSGVTGVKVGHSDLYIPVGADESYTAAADWYFPTQADGTVNAQGVIYLQHGFLGNKSWYSALATQLAQQTNSVVVAPNLPWFQLPWNCSGCVLNGAPMAQGVAGLFADPERTSLTASANAAGYGQDALPGDFVLTGHSAGGGLAATAAGFYTEAVPEAGNHLKGVVMYDGVSSSTATFAGALAKLGDTPVYQIAAPPQAWNANGQTTTDLVALRPDQFVGVVLANGSHVDSLIGGNLLADIASQLIIKRSPAGNTQAVYTLATGWIDDMYAGNTPTSPGPKYGIYGEPDQFIVMGPTAAVVLGPPPVVDVGQYSGTWYEVGSVKQFFSIGLVNTEAVYTPLPDGSIKVENSGNYFVNNGPQSTIVGNAVSLNADNNKLNVSFLGPAKATEPGNYWIVDLAPDYSWAIVSDSSGRSGFLLSRTPTVSDALYQELLDRASAKGVNGWITRTRQPQAAVTSGLATARAGLVV